MSPEDNLNDLLRIQVQGTDTFEEEDAFSRGDDLLGYLPRASPCDVAWEEMEGDNLVRCCPRCGKNVYNLTGMTGWEAADFVRETERRLGTRFYRRRDGTLLTGQCRVGLRQVYSGIVVCLSFAFLGTVLVGSVVFAAELEGPIVLGPVIGAGVCISLCWSRKKDGCRPAATTPADGPASTRRGTVR